MQPSATLKWAARPGFVFLLRHSAAVGAEFAEIRERLLALVDPVHFHRVADIFVAGDLELPRRRAVAKVHDQRVAVESVIRGLATPFSGDIFKCEGVRRAGEARQQDYRQERVSDECHAIPSVRPFEPDRF